jgi:signal transduction histidine kinase
VFSIALLFIASTAGDFAYNLPWLKDAPPFRLAFLASVFFFTNTFPVAAVIALTENRRLHEVWTEFYSWTFPYYLLGAALVGTFGFANRTLSWQSWVLILPMVYAMYRSYHLYLDRLENHSRRAEEEKRHAEQVAELLTQTMAANEALRRANKNLEQFAYAASHDLQEPLRMISIYSELLERRHLENLGPDGQELLVTIRDGAHRINDLVRDLLSYTRVDGVESAVSAAVAPEEVLDEVQEALSNRIATVDAVVTRGELIPLQVHRTHLIQLLQNLLSNSLKYRSPDRRPVIHISSIPADEGMVEIIVKDNGIGIDPAYHERIFGVFKRLHSWKVPGTGIGLAICKKIVDYYDGKIWVESTPGAGSTFHVTLPAGRSNAVFQLDSSASVPSEAPEGDSRGNIAERPGDNRRVTRGRPLVVPTRGRSQDLQSDGYDLDTDHQVAPA